MNSKFNFLLAIIVALAMCFGGTGMANAQGHSRHGGGGYRHHGGGSLWLPALVVGGLVGATIYNATRPVYVDRSPVYIAPPAPPMYSAPPQYYCDSARMYYPNTRYCPEGWQLVQP